MATLICTMARGRWQLFVAVGLSAAYLFAILPGHLVSPPPDYKQFTYALASIGAILALSGSVSFAFVIFQINQANSRKHDLFQKFKVALFDFDRFLKDYDSSYPLIAESQAFSWELKFLRMQEFPLMDWDERLSDLKPHLERERGNYDGDRNLERKILGYVGYLEELVSEIGMMCIRQIIVGVYVGTVKKIFFFLAVLVTLIAASTMGLGQIGGAFLRISPVLFGVMAALMLLEIGWYLHRESKELLDFVEKTVPDEPVEISAGE